jgi:hypothetical protein
VTLKHKNTSKWARYAAKSRNPALKRDLQEHYKLGEELRKKITTLNESESDISSSVDSEDENQNDDDENNQLDNKVTPQNQQNEETAQEINSTQSNNSKITKHEISNLYKKFGIFIFINRMS